jgi:hypothetical protein
MSFSVKKFSEALGNERTSCQSAHLAGGNSVFGLLNVRSLVFDELTGDSLIVKTVPAISLLGRPTPFVPIPGHVGTAVHEMSNLT